MGRRRQTRPFARWKPFAVKLYILVPTARTSPRVSRRSSVCRKFLPCSGACRNQAPISLLVRQFEGELGWQSRKHRSAVASSEERSGSPTAGSPVGRCCRMSRQRRCHNQDPPRLITGSRCLRSP
jgi:hypothetical protein